MSILLTEEQAKAAVKTQWQAVMNGAIPVKYENTAFIEPSPAALWVAVELRNTDSVQETLGQPGARTYLRTANVLFHVMGVVGAGTASIDAMITTLRANWEGTSFGGIDPAGASRTVPLGGDQLWYEVVLILPVQYTERK